MVDDWSALAGYFFHSYQLSFDKDQRGSIFARFRFSFKFYSENEVNYLVSKSLKNHLDQYLSQFLQEKILLSLTSSENLTIDTSLASPCPSKECWFHETSRGKCHLRQNVGCLMLKCHPDKMELEVTQSLFGENAKIQSEECKLKGENETLFLSFLDCVSVIEEIDGMLLFKSEIFTEPESFEGKFKIWGTSGSSLERVKEFKRQIYFQYEQ